MEGVEVEQAVRSGGILTAALPAPQGWMQGLSIPFYGCGEPVLSDRCVTADDTVDLNKPVVSQFQPFGISQSAACSSLSRLDQKAHAQGRLDSTTEWAVGRQLATDGLGLGTPSLADGTSLGTVADGNFAQAVGELEQAAADAGFGTQWWLHGPVKAAAFLTESRSLLGKISPTGAPWVISVGYPVQSATTVRLWVTGSVWVGVDEPFVLNDLDRRNNNDEAFANRSAIVAFDPCINFYIDVTVPASP
jgi:hypothetical protein